MASITIPAVFAAGEIGADVAAGGLAAGEIAGGALGAGVLEGTTAAGLAGLGDITGGALAAGALGGAGGLGAGVLEGAGGLTSGGLGFGAGELAGTLPTGLNAGGAAIAGGVGGGLAPAAGAGIGAPSSGALGGASASAAPASAPVSPSISGQLAGGPEFSGAGVGQGPGGTTLAGIESGGPASAKGAVDLGVTTPPVSGGLSSGGIGPLTGGVPTNAIGAPATAAAAPNSLETFAANPSLGSAWGVAKANPGLLLSGLGLGANLMMGNQALPGAKQIATSAEELANQGRTLQSYLQTGTLPPGVQSGLISAGASAKAAIKSRHASSGTSGSSSEAQELAAVDSQMGTQGANIALSLLDRGVTEAGLSNSLYQIILQNALAEDQQLGNAIGRFASSLTPTTTINLQGARV